MIMEKKNVLVINEPWYTSFAKDIVTYVGVILVVYLNHMYFDASPVLDLLGVMAIVGGMMSHNFKSEAKRMTTDEAILYFEKLKIEKGDDQ